MTAAVLGGVLALAGCRAEGPEPAALDRATGAVLADAADRLADALASDDPCRAIVEADALRERAARALETGDAPESVVDETTRVVDATTSDLSCEPVPLDEEADDGDDGDGGDDDGEVETADEVAEPAPEPAEEPAPSRGGSSDDDGGGSSGGGPPDHARPGGGGGGGGPPGDRPGRGGGRG